MNEHLEQHEAIFHRSSRRRLLGPTPLAVLLASIILIAVGLIPMHRTVRATCVLSPRAVWTLSELGPGRLESRAVDNLTGEILHYRLFQFDRSSFVSLDLTKGTGERREEICPAGTVIARIGSSDLDLEIAERLSLLEQARAHLEALRGGDKPANLDVAALAVEQARAELRVFEPELERVRTLHAGGLTTDEQLQVTEGTWEIRKLNLELAEAQLRALETGEAPARVAEAETAVSSIESELEALRAKSSATLITTPLAGKLFLGDGGRTTFTSSPSSTVLARIACDDTVVVQILVDQRQRDRVAEGQSVRVRIPGHRNPDSYGRVAHIEPTHRPMARQQIFIVRALLPNSDNPLESGMRGQARIVGPREPLLKTWVRDFVGALRRDAWPF